jgi:hypothetical protein
VNASEAQVIVAIVATGGVVVAALIPVWWQVTRMRIEHHDTNQQVGQVNDAVNHRHSISPDTPRLLDAVLEVLAWKRRWDGVDPGWDSASRLNETIGDIHRELADLRSDFNEHMTDFASRRAHDLEP